MDILYNCCDMCKDVILIFFMSINVGFQLFCSVQLVLNRAVLFSQCYLVNVYDYGIVGQTAGMFLATFTMIHTYCIRKVSCDVWLLLLLCGSIVWLVYLGLGIWLKYLSCRSALYPLLRTVVAHAVNIGLAIILMYFGARYAIRKEKRTRCSPSTPKPWQNSATFPRQNSATFPQQNSATFPQQNSATFPQQNSEYRTRNYVIPELDKNLHYVASPHPFDELAPTWEFDMTQDVQANMYACGCEECCDKQYQSSDVM